MRRGHCRGAEWSSGHVTTGTAHCTAAGTALVLRRGSGDCNNSESDLAARHMAAPSTQHPAAGTLQISADCGRGRRLRLATCPCPDLQLNAQRGAIGPCTLSGFIRASFYRTIIFILLLNMNSATLQHTHWHTVKLFRLDRIEKTHAQRILMYVM